jgi:hypothetical protein
LVDWKKVSEGKKNPAQDENGGTTLDGLYSAPLQIAAYIFSVNSSSHFSFLKKVYQQKPQNFYTSNYSK